MARKIGLHFDYTGNVHDERGQSNYCPACGERIIGRGTRPAWARLFEALGHDMVQVWSPTVDNYLGRVCKQRFLEAVREGVQLGKFAFSDAKRLFRQHRSDSEKLGLSKTSPHYPEQRT
jgi:hypothetical protein